MSNRAFLRWCRAATRTLPFARQRREAAQELYWHLEDIYQELLDRGTDPETAQAQALGAMGSARQVRQSLFWAHMSAKEGSSMLKEWREQNKWNELYRGRDQARYLKLRRALDKAEIKYQADEFDVLSRMQSQFRNNQSAGYLKRANLYLGASPQLVQLKQMGGESNNLYTLKVRGRDMVSARQAEYTLDQDLEAAEPVVHQEADLSVLKAPLTQRAYKTRTETEHINKVKGLLMDLGILLVLIGLVCIGLVVAWGGFYIGTWYWSFVDAVHTFFFIRIGLCFCLPLGLLLLIAAGVYWWRKNR